MRRGWFGYKPLRWVVSTKVINFVGISFGLNKKRQVDSSWKTWICESTCHRGLPADRKDPVVHLLLPCLRLHRIPDQWASHFCLQQEEDFQDLLLWSLRKLNSFHLLLTCTATSGFVYTKEAIMLGTWALVLIFLSIICNRKLQNAKGFQLYWAPTSTYCC